MKFQRTVEELGNPTSSKVLFALCASARNPQVPLVTCHQKKNRFLRFQKRLHYYSSDVSSDLFHMFYFVSFQFEEHWRTYLFSTGKGNPLRISPAVNDAQREVRRHSSPEVSMALSCVTGSILMSLKEHDVMTGELANLLSGENWEANTCWKRWKATGCHCFFHVFVHLTEALCIIFLNRLLAILKIARWDLSAHLTSFFPSWLLSRSLKKLTQEWPHQHESPWPFPLKDLNSWIMFDPCLIQIFCPSLSLTYR